MLRWPKQNHDSDFENGDVQIDSEVDLYKKLAEPIDGIVNRWAPPSENDTEAYINSVVKTTGLKRDQLLNLKDKEILKGLIKGIITQENGKRFLPNDVVVTTGIDLI